MSPDSATGRAGELATAGLREQAGALAAGEVRAAELIDAALANIEAVQAELSPFRVIRSEAARAEAAAADERLSAGDRAPLLGVPVAIKDDMDLAGEATLCGTACELEPKEADGEVARRLRRAGAIIVGKTNLPEFGQWPFTEGAFGATRNPWDPNHTPGGSSGGTAAAVAARAIPAGMGSDGAGSIRIPAAWTGLVGIKPQRGRVSTWPEPEAFMGLTSFGPLARTVGDAALLLDVTAGNAEGDLHRPPPPERPFADAADADPGALRIALSFRAPFSGFPSKLDPEIRAAVERLAERLASLGHQVTQSDPPYGRLVGVSFMPRSMAGIAEWADRMPDRAALDPRTRGNARTGKLLGGPALRLARSAERRVASRVASWFERFDAVVTPTTAQPPIPVGAAEGRGSTATDRIIVAACPYAWPWNVIGWPAISVPAGLTEAGLPVGASLLGPANSEQLLISLAAQLEAGERWHERVPPHAVPTARDSGVR